MLSFPDILVASSCHLLSFTRETPLMFIAVSCLCNELAADGPDLRRPFLA